MKTSVSVQTAVANKHVVAGGSAGRRGGSRRKPIQAAWWWRAAQLQNLAAGPQSPACPLQATAPFIFPDLSLREQINTHN